jgi:hypothetical protein
MMSTILRECRFDVNPLERFDGVRFSEPSLGQDPVEEFSTGGELKDDVMPKSRMRVGSAYDCWDRRSKDSLIPRFEMVVAMHPRERKD